MGKSFKVTEALSIFWMYLYHSFHIFSSSWLVRRSVNTSERSTNDPDWSVYYLLQGYLTFFTRPCPFLHSRSNPLQNLGAIDFAPLESFSLKSLLFFLLLFVGSSFLADLFGIDGKGPLLAILGIGQPHLCLFAVPKIELLFPLSHR